MAVVIATASASDLAELRDILQPEVEVRWAQTCREALPMLSEAPDAVVLCDAELPDGNWQTILRAAGERPVVVFSRFADEALWAEVLNFGVYDLLLLPFHREEVRRVTAAAQRSRQRYMACPA